MQQHIKRMGYEHVHLCIDGYSAECLKGLDHPFNPAELRIWWGIIILTKVFKQVILKIIF